jgi:hypothetical protein
MLFPWGWPQTTILPPEVGPQAYTTTPGLLVEMVGGVSLIFSLGWSQTDVCLPVGWDYRHALLQQARFNFLFPMIHFFSGARDGTQGLTHHWWSSLPQSYMAVLSWYILTYLYFSPFYLVTLKSTNCYMCAISEPCYKHWWTGLCLSAMPKFIE